MAFAALKYLHNRRPFKCKRLTPSESARCKDGYDCMRRVRHSQANRRRRGQQIRAQVCLDAARLGMHFQVQIWPGVVGSAHVYACSPPVEGGAADERVIHVQCVNHILAHSRRGRRRQRQQRHLCIRHASSNECLGSAAPASAARTRPAGPARGAGSPGCGRRGGSRGPSAQGSAPHPPPPGTGLAVSAR